MQHLRNHSANDKEIVEFLQTNYDDIDQDKPLYKVGRMKIYLKDLKNFIAAKDTTRKKRLNLIVKKVIREKKVDALKNLIEYGYRVSTSNEKGETAIHFAFRLEYDFLKQDKGKLLFSSTDEFNHKDFYGLSHLHIACALGNTVVIKKYLGNNADINAKYNREAEEEAPIYECDGFTPLHFAVIHHRYDVVKLLLEHGADVHVRDAKEKTPLWLTTNVIDYEYPSCWENDLKIIEILIKYGSNINDKTESGFTAIMDIFMHFIYYGYDVLNQSEFDVESNAFINKTIDIDRRERQKEILEIFIKNGADASLRTKSGYTLLHSVLVNLETIRIPNCFEDISFDDTMYIEMIQLILTTSSQIDVSSKDRSGESPLSLAVSYMSLDIVKLFLNYTNDLSSISFDLNTEKKHYLNVVPTFECARNLIAIVELLLGKGYKLTLEDNLTILKFLIHGIDECNCINLVLPSDLGDAVNLYSPNNISCLTSIGDEANWHISGEHLYDLQLTLELIEYAKLYIHEDIKTEVQRLLQEFDIPLTRNLYHEYRVEEVKKMKSTKLQGDVDLHYVMTKHPDTIYQYIQSNMFDEKLFESFEFYKTIIKGHFAKSLIRHYVEKSAHDYLQISIFSSLPHVCCREILSYLSNKDIYNLCFTIFTHDDLDVSAKCK